jgi:hypothetical protein
MSLDELTSRTTTRRTIVRTGTKLAYAAPLMAASIKLSGAGASADVVSGSCTAENNYCTNAQVGTCGSSPDCICSNTSLGIFCHHLTCAACFACSSDADCQAIGLTNATCVPNDDCCGASSCLTPCDSSCEGGTGVSVGTYGK